ncbi:MAG: hypothetical protein JXR45_13800 [Deltaproteobacteria bacterium]|nr:hypothetical protein [Deltaproteobacteria bacterium]
MSCALAGMFPRYGHATTPSASPAADALMVEIEGVTPDSPELFTAIRAQLSASQLVLRQVTFRRDEYNVATPIPSASLLAKQQNAEMVFWIEDDLHTCTVTFYSTKDPERVYTRVLILESDNRSSRFEVIANAVSSLLEETIFTFREKPAPPPKKIEPPTPVPEKNATWPRRRSELFAAYAGALFSPDTACHGVQMGFGVLPAEAIAIDISYTQNLTLRFETDQYRFSITSRNVDVAMAGRLRYHAVELRFGIAYSAGIRSISTESLSDNISPRPNRLNGIHSLTPFLVTAWSLSEHFALLLQLGGAIALNEHDYKIIREDGTQTTVISPFPVKFVYNIGFLIQL